MRRRPTAPRRRFRPDDAVGRSPSARAAAPLADVPKRVRVGGLLSPTERGSRASPPEDRGAARERRPSRVFSGGELLPHPTARKEPAVLRGPGGEPPLRVPEAAVAAERPADERHFRGLARLRAVGPCERGGEEDGDGARRDEAERAPTACVPDRPPPLGRAWVRRPFFTFDESRRPPTEAEECWPAALGFGGHPRPVGRAASRPSVAWRRTALNPPPAG